MMGSTEAEAVMCDQLLDELMDLRNKMVRLMTVAACLPALYVLGVQHL